MIPDETSHETHFIALNLVENEFDFLERDSLPELFEKHRQKSFYAQFIRQSRRKVGQAISQVTYYSCVTRLATMSLPLTINAIMLIIGSRS